MAGLCYSSMGFLSLFWDSWQAFLFGWSAYTPEVPLLKLG